MTVQDLTVQDLAVQDLAVQERAVRPGARESAARSPAGKGAARRGALLASALLGLALLPAFAGSGRAQSAPPEDGVKAVLGAWEISNADRDRTCTVTLRGDAAAGGRALQWEGKCAQVFPFTKGIAAWDVGDRDALRLLDAHGKTVIELSEVEGGLYEGERPGEGLLFMQSTAAEAAASGRTAEQMAGEWAFTRADGKAICVVSLSLAPVAKAPPPQEPAANDKAASAALALTLQPGCADIIAAFALAAWQMDRGQLVLHAKGGDAWRFEEDDAGAWRRIPQGRNPLRLKRQ